MSGLIRYMPVVPLDEFVDYFYVNLQPLSDLSSQEYAHPAHPRLVIQYATPYPGNIKGVFSLPWRHGSMQGDMPVIGIRFKPYGLYAGFGIRGELTANHVVPASTFFSKAVDVYVSRVSVAGDFQAAVQILNDSLYNELRPKPVLYEIIEMIDALLQADLAKHSQKSLALAFQRTPKSFIDVFRRTVGITPLSYLHMYKVEEAKRIINERPALSLTDVAHDLGFYDQSHFIRIFKAHAGVSPLQYKRRLKQRPG